MSNEPEVVSIFELAKRTDLPSTFKYPGSEKPKRGLLRVGYTVNCAICTDWFESYQEPSRKSFVQEARKLGWKLTRKQGWICPAAHEESTNGD